MQRVLVAGATGYFSDLGDLLAFFTTMATSDVVAPPNGTRTLEAHFLELGGES